jgi:predicted nucleotidyltransferase
MEIEKVKSVLSAWAKPNPLIQRVFVFGSRVRSDHRPDSDLDVAIELDPKACEAIDETRGFATWATENRRWAKELQKLLPFQLQLEYYEGEGSPTIQAGITRSSVLAYEKAT